ncbi:MAG: HAD-IB family hydrolase [Anaerolineae bacterium]
MARRAAPPLLRGPSPILDSPILPRHWQPGLDFYGSKAVLWTEAFEHMRGQDNAIIEPRVREWFNAEVRDRVRPGALTAIAQHRAAGDLLVVATSSSHYVAGMAMETFGFAEAICTRLEIENGLLTGHIVSAIGANKAVRAVEWAQARGAALVDCTFYSDSITDLPLLDKVGRPVVVNPDRRLHRLALQRGWPILDWGVSPMTARPQ